MSAERWATGALVVVHLMLALLYSWAVPLGEGPDEPGHAAFVYHVARTGTLPVQWASAANAGRPIAGAPVNPDTERVEDDAPGEGHQPPLAYLLAVPAAWLLPVAERRFDLPGNPRFIWSGGGAARNAAFHGTRELWPWPREVWVWRLMRLPGALCGALTVLLTYGIARRMGSDSPQRAQSTQSQMNSGGRWSMVGDQSPVIALPLLAAALVALNPQLIFSGALISNDPLLTLLAALLLWLAVGGGGLHSWRRALALGLVLGLALLTKQSAALLVPVAVIGAAGWGLSLRSGALASRGGNAADEEFPHGVTPLPPSERRERSLQASSASGAPERAARAEPARAPASVPQASSASGARASASERPPSERRERSPRASAASVALCLVVAALLSGWWYVRNWQLYGDPLALAVFRAEFATQPFDWRSAAAWGGALTQLYASFWARFGWLTVAPPLWVDLVYAALGLLAGAGLIAAAVGGRWSMVGGRRSSGHPVIWSSRSALLWLTVLLALAWVLAFALSTGLVAWQGRLLFPALAAVAVLAALGLERLAGRYARAVTWLVIFALAGLALWLPFGVIRPTYPFVPLSVAAAQTQRAALTASYGRFGRPSDPGAELLGWRAELARDDRKRLVVTLLWHALGRQNRDWTTFLHLVDGSGGIVAEVNAQPTSGSYPMSAWVQGDWVRDTQVIELPETLAPGSYTLRAGLWDPNWGGRRAGMYDRRGKLAGDYLDLGTITVP